MITVASLAATHWHDGQGWDGPPWPAFFLVVFLTVGGTIAFLVSDDMGLRHPDEAAAFAATALQMIAVAVASVAGLQAFRQQRD